MVKIMKSYDKVFLTGCDSNTEWMLGWFIQNYRRFNSTPLIFANFGISEEMHNIVASGCDGMIDLQSLKEEGWLKKPQAMIEASKIADKVCWIDTDCQILANIDPIFELTVPNKLSMAEDKPWSKRREEVWHNSGVVLFQDRPPILDTWATAVKAAPREGDQETLHRILREQLNRQIHVSNLPTEYNWLRLMIQDGQDSPRKKIMHWTGNIGKKYIRGLING